MDFDSAWLAVAAALGTLALSIIGQYAAADIARRQKKADRREDFQRETLIELQEALYQYMRSLNMMWNQHERKKAGDPPIEWPPGVDPIAMSHAYVQRVPVLTERVNDDRLRQLLLIFRGGYATLADAATDAESFTLLNRMRDIQDVANERIGVLLRQL